MYNENNKRKCKYLVSMKQYSTNGFQLNSILGDSFHLFKFRGLEELRFKDLDGLKVP